MEDLSDTKDEYMDQEKDPNLMNFKKIKIYKNRVNTKRGKKKKVKIIKRKVKLLNRLPSYERTIELITIAYDVSNDLLMLKKYK